MKLILISALLLQILTVHSKPSRSFDSNPDSSLKQRQDFNQWYPEDVITQKILHKKNPSIIFQNNDLCNYPFGSCEDKSHEHSSIEELDVIGCLFKLEALVKASQLSGEDVILFLGQLRRELHNCQNEECIQDVLSGAAADVRILVRAIVSMVEEVGECLEKGLFSGDFYEIMKQIYESVSEHLSTEIIDNYSNEEAEAAIVSSEAPVELQISENSTPKPPLPPTSAYECFKKTKGLPKAAFKLMETVNNIVVRVMMESQERRDIPRKLYEILSTENQTIFDDLEILSFGAVRLFDCLEDLYPVDLIDGFSQLVGYLMKSSG